MSGEERLGLGLIGIGNTGRTHLTALNSMIRTSLLDINIAAICDIDEKILRTIADDFEIPEVFSDFNSLVENEDVDVVYVLGPTDTRVSMIKAAARAGKAVFSKKPIAHSGPQARDVMAVVQDAKVPSGVALALRYDPFLLYARNLLEQCDFGRPVSAHIRVDQHLPEGTKSSDEPEEENGVSIIGRGTLVEQSIQDLDALAWLLGPVDSVFCKIGFFNERNTEDMASVMLTHKNGAVSTLSSVWHHIDRANERRMEFFFDRGFIGITLESGKRKLDYQLGEKSPVRVHPETAESALLEHLGMSSNEIPLEAYNTLIGGRQQRYAALSYSFLKSIRDGKPPSPNFRDAVAVQSIVDAAYDSATRGQPLDIL